MAGKGLLCCHDLHSGCLGPPLPKGPAVAGTRPQAVGRLCNNKVIIDRETVFSYCLLF